MTGKALFGGEKGWNEADWTDSDDRVRGGKSQSYLECYKNHAIFYGTLDIKTLGGAGFASQRTSSDDQTWDLASYDGIELTINTSDSDDKKYTFILKDHLLAPDAETGREQATISWEVDFVVPRTSQSNEGNHLSVFLGWQDFRPTYRGKEQKCKDGPKLGSIKRMSIMARSFFGTQQGDFRITLVSIQADKNRSSTNGDTLSRQPTDDISVMTESLKKESKTQASVWYWLLGKCGKL